MKKLLLVLVLISNGFIAIADSTPIESCAYKETKRILEIVKSTVGLKSMSQLNAIRDGTVQKLFCKSAIESSGLSTEDAGILIKNGINLALSESLGEISSANGNIRQFQGQDWQQFAIKNLVQVIRDVFSDSSVNLVDANALTSKVDSDHSDESGISFSTRELSGQVKLSNEFSCNVISKIVEPNLPNPSQECIMVKIGCQNGSSIRLQEVQRNCGSLGLDK